MGQRTLFTVGHSTRRVGGICRTVEGLANRRATGRQDGASVAGISLVLQATDEVRPREGRNRLSAPAGPGRIAACEARIRTTRGGGTPAFEATPITCKRTGFEMGLKELNDRRKKRRVCVMCSEAVWWRCHRRMIADAEVIRGIPVQHVMSETTATRHELTQFAVVKKQRGRVPVITYPANDE